ncbi:MAG: PH domain-containing protein [Planctomycetota bacterium]
MATPSKFTAPWSTSLKATTVFVYVLLFVTIAVAIYKGAPMPLILIVPGVAVLTVCVTALFIIRGYELTHDELLIPRLIWTNRIPLSGLSGAIADPKASYGSIRLCGNGGLYCFCGWFWNSRFGMYRVFATDFKKTVVLTIDGKTILVTPGDPEGFVKAIKEE